MSLQTALHRVVEGHTLTAEESQAALADVMAGTADERSLAAFLTALRVRGETVDEVAGAARAMRDAATKVPVHGEGLLDTCGTGGDQLHTFNISTAAALVAASAGVPVAKHGNRGVSSSSGSANVLAELGVNIQLTPNQVARCIDEVGLGFCFAPLLHSAMKHAVPVRQALGYRTLFNLLGPLTNPAGADYQLLGASRIETAAKLAGALSQLDVKRAFVVCGNDELDEVSLWGETRVFDVQDGDVTELKWSPSDFGLPACAADQLRVDGPQESAAVIRRIFEGTSGPHRDMVLANAAAALLVTGKVTSLSEGVEAAAAAIDSKSSADLLAKLIEFSAQSGA